MSGIAIFNSAVSQLQSSQKNLLAISQARRKMEMEEENHAFKKKKNEIDLETAKREGKMSELEFDILSSQQKAYEKQQAEISKGNIAQIKMAEHKEKTVADQALNWAKIGFKSDPQGVLSFLQARDRNLARKQLIQPKMAYGKIGYETVDVEDEEMDTEDKQLSRESKKLDIEKKKKELEGDGEYSASEIRAAQSLADNDADYDTPYETKLKAALPKAREILSGKSKDPIEQEQPETKQFRNKKTGKTETFKKDGSGKWVKAK